MPESGRHCRTTAEPARGSPPPHAASGRCCCRWSWWRSRSPAVSPCTTPASARTAPTPPAPATPDIDLAARAAAVDKVLKKRAQAVLTDNEKDVPGRRRPGQQEPGRPAADPVHEPPPVRFRETGLPATGPAVRRRDHQEVRPVDVPGRDRDDLPDPGHRPGPGPRDARLHVHRAADRRLDAGVRHRPGQAAAARLAPGGVGHRRRAGQARAAGSRGGREGPGPARDQAGRDGEQRGEGGQQELAGRLERLRRGDRARRQDRPRRRLHRSRRTPRTRSRWRPGSTARCPARSPARGSAPTRTS